MWAPRPGAEGTSSGTARGLARERILKNTGGVCIYVCCSCFQVFSGIFLVSVQVSLVDVEVSVFILLPKSIQENRGNETVRNNPYSKT